MSKRPWLDLAIPAKPVNWRHKGQWRNCCNNAGGLCQGCGFRVIQLDIEGREDLRDALIEFGIYFLESREWENEFPCILMSSVTPPMPVHANLWRCLTDVWSGERFSWRTF